MEKSGVFGEWMPEGPEMTGDTASAGGMLWEISAEKDRRSQEHWRSCCDGLWTVLFYFAVARVIMPFSKKPVYTRPLGQE